MVHVTITIKTAKNCFLFVENIKINFDFCMFYFQIVYVTLLKKNYKYRLILRLAGEHVVNFEK